MQTYSSRKPKFWKNKYDDIFDSVAAPKAKQLFVESWLRQLPDRMEPNIEILRDDVCKSRLDRKPSGSSITDVIDVNSILPGKEYRKFNKPDIYKTVISKPRLPTPIPNISISQTAENNTTEGKTEISDLISTQITESVISDDKHDTSDETDDVEISHIYTWTTASTTPSSESKIHEESSKEKKHFGKVSTTSIHWKTLRKKVLNSTAKNDAKNIESVNFSQNFSYIQNHDTECGKIHEESSKEKNDFGKVSTPSIQWKTLKKKVLNSTAKNDAKNIESVNFSQNFSSIPNHGTVYGKIPGALSKEKKKYRKMSAPCICWKTLRKKLLNSTAKNDTKNIDSVNFSQNISSIQNYDSVYGEIHGESSKEKNDFVKVSKPTICWKTLRKKVLNSTAKNDAKNIESVNFSQNFSSIQNHDTECGASRQQQLEQSTPFRHRDNSVHNGESQKKLQKKAKKHLISTVLYQSGTNIEETFNVTSSIFTKGCNVTDGSDKTLKKKSEEVTTESLGDKTVTPYKKVQIPKCALTSTPIMDTAKNHLPALHIDVSSLGPPSSDSNDIIFLRQSESMVNSEEIVAESFDEDVEFPDVKDICFEMSSSKVDVRNEHLGLCVQVKTNNAASEKARQKVNRNGLKNIFGEKKMKNVHFPSRCRNKYIINKKNRQKSVRKSEVTERYQIKSQTSLNVCSASIVPIGPITKPTEIIHIKSPSKQFWERIKTFPFDPLTTIMKRKAKLKITSTAS